MVFENCGSLVSRICVPSVRARDRLRRLVRCGGFSLAAALACGIASAQVRISQIYGGGGDTAAQYLSDYIEIYNSGAPQSVSGWSVQYAAASGTTWTVTALPAMTLGTGQYLLVKEADGTTITAGQTLALPFADATGTIAMATTAGKVALVNTTTALTGGTPTGAQIMDFVGYGTTATWNEPGAPFTAANNAPPPSANNAIFRNMCGGQDLNDNNSDWSAGAPNPRNISTAVNAGLSAGGMCNPYFAEPTQTIKATVFPYNCGGDRSRRTRS